MEKHHAQYNPVLLFLFYLFLFLCQLSSLLLVASAYSPPEKTFINCGSASNATVGDRNFVGDVNPGPFGFSTGKSSPVQDSNSSAQTPALNQTARVFTHPSRLGLHIDQNGTYVVRLHFYPFSSPQRNLADAQFHVSASGFPLLSNFSGSSSGIKEFLLGISVGRFRIFFRPCQPSSFAFINAIEVFLAPPSFIPHSASHVTPFGSQLEYTGLLSRGLHVIHRINVGGSNVTPENDTLWRSWVPDDDYVFNPNAARIVPYYYNLLTYLPEEGGSSEYDAPDLVYKSAKELNIDPNRASNFSIPTWLFKAEKNARHFVRLHFCDIVSISTGILQINLFVYGNFRVQIDPSETIPRLAAPFHSDFVVDSDGSGFMIIGIGPREENQEAFLNGLEIMGIIGESDVEDKAPKKKHRFVIIGSVAGGVAFLFGLVVAVAVTVVLFWVMKCRKAKPLVTMDWPSVRPYAGSSHDKMTERSSNGSAVPNLSLELRLPFGEILYATKSFNPRLMIGEGGFGKVYEGTLRNGMKVAVKRSQPGHGQGLQEFQTEIMVLSKIRYLHLVSLVGYCDERGEMILVYEFMKKGTLRDFLYDLNGNSNKPSSRPALSWTQRLQICIGAAKGLHYLHTCSDGVIIHRDVKSTNILLDEYYVAKIADFGLSRSGLPDQPHVSTDVKGSFGYLDPEYFRCLQLTQKSDVYSFGVVLLEVLCARPAINNSLPQDEVNLAEWGMSWQKKGELEKIIDPLLVGKINPSSLRKFGETAEKCVKDCGDERPSMHDVLWDLEYAMQLQQTGRLGDPFEDSLTDASWQSALPAVQRLPSYSIPFDESEVPLKVCSDGSDASLTSASQVFSQLRIRDAR